MVQEAQRAQQQKDAEAAARGKKAKLARIREKYGDQVGARLLPPMHGPSRPLSPSMSYTQLPPLTTPCKGDEGRQVALLMLMLASTDGTAGACSSHSAPACNPHRMRRNGSWRC